MTKKNGQQSVKFQNPPVIISTGTVVGPYEKTSPLQTDFDYLHNDVMAGEESFEKAERSMLLQACHTALTKINTPAENIEFFISGDLLNQIISAGFTAKQLEIPFFGIYGACSTSVEGLILGSVLIDGGFANLVMAATSSHNSTAERQFRYPTEYGTKRKPFAQRTVTGAGAAVLSVNDSGATGPKITYATVGKVIDLGCKDPLDLGAAMAPAAADTIAQHFSDTGRNPDYYDLILTGDLGKVGFELAIKWIAEKHQVNLTKNYRDCGVLIYDPKDPRVHAGGSGCGCAAVVAYGHIYKRLLNKEINKVLLVATGAMHSPTSCLQKENIPCIAHAVSLEN